MSGNEFSRLRIDEILQLSQTDNDHAFEIDEQAQATTELCQRVDAALTEIGRASQKLSGSDWQSIGEAFAGRSGDAAARQVDSLLGLTREARESMRPQPRVFAALAKQVRDTHGQISRLRGERDEWLTILRGDPKDPALNAEFGGLAGRLGLSDPADLERAIHERYDTDARDAMSTAGSGYLTEVQRLAEVPSYQGPRISRPTSEHDRPDFDTGYHPGPELRSGPASTSAVAPSMAAPSDVAHEPPATGAAQQPELQTPGAPSTPAAVAPSAVTPVGDVHVPARPVIPPVIGARPTTTPTGLGGPASSLPPRSGPTRPLSTPAVAKPAPSAVSRQPGGLVRPVIGGRPTVPTGRTPTVGRTGTAAPGIPSSMARYSRGAAPGTRAAKARDHQPSGRVIGRRVPSPSPDDKTVAKVNRVPRIVHGGNENPNRPVIRNLRAISPPARRDQEKSDE